MHPLHTPDWVVQYIKASGEYPGSRATGRSTAQALRLIAQCIESPRTWYACLDHHGTRLSHANLRHTAQGLVSDMGLRYFKFRDTEMCFGEPV